MTIAYIALGSNLGDRRYHLNRALEALRQHPRVKVSRVSSYHETEPVGGPPGQDPYLNAAAELDTDLPPAELLNLLLEVERGLGRVRSEPNAPRTIDLDLLLYGDSVLISPDLIVPHPRMLERLFVLLPLVEIAAQAIHPMTAKTIGQLCQEVLAAKCAQLQRDRLQLSEDESSLMRLMELENVHQEKVRQEFRRLGQNAIEQKPLHGQHALVTGSTSGIGAAIARELAGAGASVIVHGRRLKAAEEIVRHVPMMDCKPILADLRDPEECRRLVRTAWERHDDGIDIWINNAGADTLTGEAAFWPFEKKLQELLAVDLTAAMLLSRDVGERMRQRGSGVILNMSWDQAETGMEGDSGQLFAAVKAGVAAFTKSLALTLAPQVRVNCLAPGWIRTAWGQQASSAWQERAVRETPLARWGMPGDVAAAARWLVSPAADFITGQVIRINGGAVR